MIHINNLENRFMTHRNAKPILAYKIGFSGKNTNLIHWNKLCIIMLSYHQHRYLQIRKKSLWKTQ